MDYEKAYKEALDRARVGMQIDEVFPELHESEDERIKKEIVAALRQLDSEKSPVDTYHYLEWADWLEKQKGPQNTSASTMIPSCWSEPLGEQKPTEWNEEDEEMRLACIDIIEHFPIPSGTVCGPWSDCINWLKLLPERFNPQLHWKPSEQ